MESAFFLSFLSLLPFFSYTLNMTLTTFFNQNKSSTSLLSRQNTVSHTKSTDTTEFVPKPLTRSNTTLSKVKRFGSLLVRNKKSSSTTNLERPRVDTIFPTPIDTSLASSYSLSSSLTHTNSSSDEDELITPITPIKDMTFSDKKVQEELAMVTPTVMDESVTPEIQTNQVQEITSIKGEEAELQISLSSLNNNNTSIDPLTLSGVSLVRYHLNLALEKADEEIETELESYRLEMLQSISAIPSIVY